MNEEIVIITLIITPLGHHTLVSHAYFRVFVYVLPQKTTLKQIR